MPMECVERGYGWAAIPQGGYDRRTVQKKGGQVAAHVGVMCGSPPPPMPVCADNAETSLCVEIETLAPIRQRQVTRITHVRTRFPVNSTLVQAGS